MSLMKNLYEKWWGELTNGQKLWVCGSTLMILLLGIISGDSWVNILIGTVGMFYVSVYSTGFRGAFLLGIVYVSLYTVICLQNRIMLDALQNIVLIPIYIISFIYWGKKDIKPKNLNRKNSVMVICGALCLWGLLFGLSKLLHGNYSALDSLNTTCTLFAMILGLYGISLNWMLWSINNVVSAVIFGMALFTPTGSLTVFAMKVIFMVNGLIGWYNFYKIGKGSDHEQ